MNKAFEYEVRYDSKGRLAGRRWSVGPVLITTVAGLILSFTGHSAWASIEKLVQLLK